MNTLANRGGSVGWASAERIPKVEEMKSAGSRGQGRARHGAPTESVFTLRGPLHSPF